MDIKEKRKRRLAAVDNEQAILEAMMPYIERLEDCTGAPYVNKMIDKLEDVAAEVGAFLANYEDR